MSEKQPVVDVQDQIKKGVAFRIAPDQVVGNPDPNEVAKRDTRPPWERWQRKVTIYTKEPPSYDGRLQTSFKTTEKCAVPDERDKSGKCQNFLIATRAVNFHPLWDETHTGMQLEYDFKDFRYYLFCYKHGPFPAGPDHWD